jgi:hypothetical protein
VPVLRQFASLWFNRHLMFLPSPARLQFTFRLNLTTPNPS